jgi:hypothetical protein
LANGFLGLSIPQVWQAPMWLFNASAFALEAAVVFLLVMLVFKAITQRTVMPLPAMCMLATGICIFTAGKDMAGILWLYAPALFHGSQYAVIAGAHYLKQHHLSLGLPASKLFTLLGQSVGMRYMGFLFMGAVFFYVGLPRVLLCHGLLRDPKLRKALVT